MQYKVETSLRNFPAWCGGKDTLDTLIERDDCDAVEDLLDNIFFETDVTDGDINDYLWFNRDEIAEHLGYEDWEAYEEGWSVEDLENADEWFFDLEDVAAYERISGKKRSDWEDGDDGEGYFMEAVEIWWEGLDGKTKVEIYYKENE